MNLNDEKKFRAMIYSNLDMLFEKLYQLSEKEEEEIDIHHA